MTGATHVDPFSILGVASDAGEAEVRARYLELVKQHAPDRDPEKFREIHAAFEAAKDPLVIARRLTVPPLADAPKWGDVLEAQKRNPPRFSAAFLVSLGNKSASDGTTDRGAGTEITEPSPPAGEGGSQGQNVPSRELNA